CDTRSRRRGTVSCPSARAIKVCRIAKRPKVGGQCVAPALDCPGARWARQDFPPALRGLDPPSALPGFGNYRSYTAGRDDVVTGLLDAHANLGHVRARFQTRQLAVLTLSSRTLQE